MEQHFQIWNRTWRWFIVQASRFNSFAHPFPQTFFALRLLSIHKGCNTLRQLLFDNSRKEWFVVWYANAMTRRLKRKKDTNEND